MQRQFGSTIQIYLTTVFSEDHWMCSVSHGVGFNRGVSAAGVTGAGTVSHLAAPSQTATCTAVFELCLFCPMPTMLCHTVPRNLEPQSHFHKWFIVLPLWYVCLSQLLFRNTWSVVDLWHTNIAAKHGLVVYNGLYLT